mgnify:FL=1
MPYNMRGAEIKDKYNIDRGKSAYPIDRALSSINNQIPDLMNLLKTEPEFLQGLKGALGQLASLSNGMVKIWHGKKKSKRENYTLEAD